jgi:hypothetical protein
MKRWYLPMITMVFLAGFQLAAFADNCALCPGSTTCTTPSGCTITSTSPAWGCCADEPADPECCQYDCYTVTYWPSPTCSTVQCIYRTYKYCEREATCISGHCYAN